MPLRIIRRTAMVVGACVGILWIAGALQSIRRAVILRQRIEDVRRIVEAYAHTGLTNMADICVYLREQGVQLHNPMPRDRSLPSYAFGAKVVAGRGEVIVEETTNILDNTFRVRAYVDGSIRVERWTEGGVEEED